MSALSYLEEGWEGVRSEHVRNALEAMSEICKDGKIEPKARIDAARTIDSISDSILKIYVMNDAVSEAKRASDRGSQRIADSIKKLKDGDGEE